MFSFASFDSLPRLEVVLLPVIAVFEYKTVCKDKFRIVVEIHHNGGVGNTKKNHRFLTPVV